jgi:hypothetical protein
MCCECGAIRVIGWQSTTTLDYDVRMGVLELGRESTKAMITAAPHGVVSKRPQVSGTSLLVCG